MSNKIVVFLLILAINLSFCYTTEIYAYDFQKTSYSTEELNVSDNVAIEKDIMQEKIGSQHSDAANKIVSGTLLLAAGISIWNWLNGQSYGGLGLAPIYGSFGLGLVLIGAGSITGGVIEIIVPAKTLQRIHHDEPLQVEGWVSSNYTSGRNIWGNVDVIKECDLHKEANDTSEILARIPIGYRFYPKSEEYTQKNKKVEKGSLALLWYLVSFQVGK